VLLYLLEAIIFVLASSVAAVGQTTGPPTAAITYRIETAAGIPSLDARFSTEQIVVLEMLNRADATRLRRLDALVVPQTWLLDAIRYSPFPLRYPWGAADSRLLVVDQPGQAFAAYESGTLVRWGPVSSGREALQTPAGLFHLTWHSPGRHSTVDPDWFMPWYFNFQNDRGLSFHEYALPGRPASHACVRLLERDAKWLFDWGQTWTLDDRGWTVLNRGTPVLISGCYDFDAPPPWRSLDWLSKGITLPAAPATEPFQCQ
jgi:lipoprotein-anchoring transpeptidase ErfK/SrfK